LRKIDAERATWIARLRDDAGRQASHSIGYAPAPAEAWFKTRESGVTDEVVTVGDACRAYVEDGRREKGAATAHDAEKRFQRTVYKTGFGDIALAKLRTPHLKAWRDGLKIGKASSNRTLTTLKAALNLAVTHRQVSAAATQEWRHVKAHNNAGTRRDLYLDLAQRRALLQHASGAIRDLIEAVMLTGCRAGEVVNATRAQFDARTQSMTFTGKTGRRIVPLSPAAVEGRATTAEAARAAETEIRTAGRQIHTRRFFDQRSSRPRSPDPRRRRRVAEAGTRKIRDRFKRVLQSHAGLTMATGGPATGEPLNRDDPMAGPLIALRRGQFIADERQHLRAGRRYRGRRIAHRCRESRWPGVAHVRERAEQDHVAQRQIGVVSDEEYRHRRERE
jgi:hypothetical protein